MPQKRKRIIAGILFTVFALYYANISFFSHSHIINGVTIVHSHIHNKAHAQSGSHTESELTLISTLSVFQSFAVDAFFAGLMIFLAFQLFILPIFTERTTADSSGCVSLRAPPALF